MPRWRIGDSTRSRMAHRLIGGLGLAAGIVLACTSDRLVAPRSPLPPVPALDQLAVRFVRFDLGNSSPPVTVHLSNTGEDSLGTISVTSITYLTARTGWLLVDVTNNADSNGATIVLTPTFAGAVQASADSATVTFAASGTDSSRTVTVTSQVLPGAKIGFSVPALTFAVGTAAAASQTGVIAVLNTANGPADLSPVTTAVAPAATWLSVAPSTPAGYFSVTANPSGLAAGNYSTFVRFTSPIARLADSVPVTLSIGNPVLLVSPAFAAFAGGQGDVVTAPTEGYIDATITNGGTGVLGTLSIDPPEYNTGEPTGWLSTALNGSVVRLTPAVGSLAPGTYTARVPVRAAGGGGLTVFILVQFKVSPVTPPSLVLQTRRLDLQGTKVDCTGVPVTWPCFSTNPGSFELNLFNGGGGNLPALVLLGSQIPVIYTAGQPTGWIIAVAGGNFVNDAVRIIGQNVGALPIGTFSAKVPVDLVGGLTDTITVQLTVRQGTPPTCMTCSIGIPPSVGFQSSGSTEDGVEFSVYSGSSIPQPPPAPITITVVNAGNTGSVGTITLGATQYAAGQPTGWLTVSALSGSTAPATMTLSLTAGAPPAVGGPYQALVPITSTGGGSASLAVNFSVFPVPRISLVPRGVTLIAGTSLATTGVFTENIGGGRRTGNTPGTPIYTAGQPTGWLNVASCCEGFGIDLGGVATGLAPGTYTAKLPVTINTSPPTTAPEATDTLAVTFVVPAPAQPAILRLGAQTVTLAGLAGDTTHATYTVPTFNSGTGSLGTLSVDPPVYNPSAVPTWLTASVAGTGIALDARPVGLTPETDYQARVTVRATGADSAVQLTVLYRLNRPVQAFATPVISFGTDTLRFTYSLASGGTGGIADTVTVEDARQSTIPLLGLQVGQPAYVAGSVGWVVGAFLESATAPTTLAVAVKGQGLAEGTYLATLPVSAATPDVESQTLPVLLTVTP
jgi:hypothetical protein